MNLNSIINMIIRSVVRQITQRGVKAGFDAFDNRGKRKASARGEIADGSGARRDPNAQRDDI